MYLLYKFNYLQIYEQLDLLDPNKLAAYMITSRELPVKLIALTPCNVFLRSSSASAKISIVSPSRNLYEKKKNLKNIMQSATTKN